MQRARLILIISIITAIAVGTLGVEALNTDELSGQSKSPLLIQSAQAAEPPRAKTKLLMEQKLEGLPGFKVQVVYIESPPGSVGSQHYHPGHVFGYVFEGAYSLSFKDLTSNTIRTGEVFYETPNTVMRSRNASSTEVTKMVVFQVMPEDQPPVISVK